MSGQKAFFVLEWRRDSVGTRSFITHCIRQRATVQDRKSSRESKQNGREYRCVVHFHTSQKPSCLLPLVRPLPISNSMLMTLISPPSLSPSFPPSLPPFLTSHGVLQDLRRRRQVSLALVPPAHRKRPYIQRELRQPLVPEGREDARHAWSMGKGGRGKSRKGRREERKRGDLTRARSSSTRAIFARSYRFFLPFLPSFLLPMRTMLLSASFRATPVAYAVLMLVIFQLSVPGRETTRKGGREEGVRKGDWRVWMESQSISEKTQARTAK